MVDSIFPRSLGLSVSRSLWSPWVSLDLSSHGLKKPTQPCFYAANPKISQPVDNFNWLKGIFINKFYYFCRRKIMPTGDTVSRATKWATKN